MLIDCDEDHVLMIKTKGERSWRWSYAKVVAIRFHLIPFLCFTLRQIHTEKEPKSVENRIKKVPSSSHKIQTDLVVFYVWIHAYLEDKSVWISDRIGCFLYFIRTNYVWISHSNDSILDDSPGISDRIGSFFGRFPPNKDQERSLKSAFKSFIDHSFC